MKPMRAIWMVLLLAACGGRDAAWDRQGGRLGPVVLKDRLAWVDGARDRVVFVEGSARVSSAAIGRRAVALAPLPERDGVLVVTRGQEGAGEGGHDEPPGLYLVRDGAPVRYEIGSPFDRLAVAADGA